MTTYFTPSNIPWQFHASGAPAASYVLHAFDSGASTTARTMYSDNAGTSAGTSITLDSEGYISTSGTRHPLWLDSARNYRLELRDTTDVTVVWQADNVSIFSSGIGVTFDSFNDAKAADNTGYDTVVTRSFLGSWSGTTAGPKGGATYHRDGTTGTASTAYSKNNGFYDAAGDGFRLPGDKVRVTQLGATGDGSTDDYQAIQNAVDLFFEIEFEDNATYMTGTTIREATNAGKRRVYGGNRNTTVVKATSTLATSGAPIFWFGNSSGHGNYRLDFERLLLNGGDEAGNGAAGAIGLRAHECGTSYAGDITFRGTRTAIEAIGCIGSSFGGQKTEIFTSQQGIIMTVPTGAGSGLDPDDILNTESPLSLNTNANNVQNVWFGAVKKTALAIRGGLTHAHHCVFQSCGDATDVDVVLIENANESQDYGGGAGLSWCWWEGGTSRAYVRIKSTRDAFVERCFMSGTGSQTEQGIVVDDTSPGVQIIRNSFRNNWTATPTESRSTNASYYVDDTCRSGTFMGNYHTRNTVTPFIDYSIATHNHIVIDNHASDNTTRGLTVGNITIRNDVISGAPDHGISFNWSIDDPSLRRADCIGGFTFETATTAALEDITNAVNTTDKRENMFLYNTTTGLLVRAGGPAAGDTWRNGATGAVAHTPS